MRERTQRLCLPGWTCAPRVVSVSRGGAAFARLTRLFAAAVLAMALLLATGCHSGAARGPRPQQDRRRVPAALERPNIVLIMADDQRWDSLIRPGTAAELTGIMPNVERLLVREGVLFTEAVVSNPVCCPSRSSLWSGGFESHHTGVLSNHFPNGGATRFHDSRTLATFLHRAGYRTIFIGRYLNDYEQLTIALPEQMHLTRWGYVPPGWDAFIAYFGFPEDWHDYSITVGGSTVDAAAPGIRLPDDSASLAAFLRDQVEQGFPAILAEGVEALDFAAHPHISTMELGLGARVIQVAEQDPARPFFLILSSAAPHGPATPTVEDRALFSDFLYRGRAWGEEDLSDKPRFVRGKARRFDRVYGGSRRVDVLAGGPDAFHADQLRSLQALDRTVGEIVSRVEANPALRDRTVFIYTADHGVLWGEHKILSGKKLPYEESIRVPLVIKIPGMAPAVISNLVAADLDLGATILHLAGHSEAEIRDVIKSDGLSLVPLMRGQRREHRDHVLIQDFGRGQRTRSGPSWASIRTQRWKYVLYETGEEELYDLEQDPFELDSLHDRNRGRAVIDRLAPHLERRGLTISMPAWSRGRLPGAVVGHPFRLELVAIGGEPPYSWTDRTGEMFGLSDDACTAGLPPGLALTAEGLISGVPAQRGCFEFAVVVEDSSISPQHGGPQIYGRAGVLTVREID